MLFRSISVCIPYSGFGHIAQTERMVFIRFIIESQLTGKTLALMGLHIIFVGLPNGGTLDAVHICGFSIRVLLCQIAFYKEIQTAGAII